MTRQHSILNELNLPDSSGNVWREPLSRVGTNDVWKFLVWRFKESGAARVTLHGRFKVPSDYVTAAVIVIVWSTTLTSGDVVWDFEYRTVGGDDTTSLDQAGTEESLTVTDAAPTASLRRLTPTVNPTDANFSADETVEYTLSRDLSDAADTLAGDAIVVDVLFQYSDV